jgi:hypothetical protein
MGINLTMGIFVLGLIIGNGASVTHAASPGKRTGAAQSKKSTVTVVNDLDDQDGYDAYLDRLTDPSQTSLQELIEATSAQPLELGVYATKDGKRFEVPVYESKIYGCQIQNQIPGAIVVVGSELLSRCYRLDILAGTSGASFTAPGMVLVAGEVSPGITLRILAENGIIFTGGSEVTTASVYLYAGGDIRVNQGAQITLTSKRCKGRFCTANANFDAKSRDGKVIIEDPTSIVYLR